MVSLPFGRHKGAPLADVPASYLQWALRECKLSSGLRAGLAAELARRGIKAPPQPPPPPPLACQRCPPPHPGLVARWQEDCNGGRRIRGECARCRHWVTYLPQVEPYVSQADAAASPTPVLDVLTRLEALGIALHSDGTTCWVRDGWDRVPPDLRALVKQCSHSLAVLLGDTGRRRRAAARCGPG
jgi:hypothetical protein